MYRKPSGQMRIEEFVLPFEGKLDPKNRWVKLSQLIPWEEIEKKYAQLFPSKTGTEYNVPIKQDKVFDSLSEPDTIKDRKLSGRKVHIIWPEEDNLQQNSKLMLYWNSLRRKNSSGSWRPNMN